MNKEKKITIIGGGQTGKTAALIAAKLPLTLAQVMTIDEMIERERGISITPSPRLTMINRDYNQQAFSSRAQRRAEERKTKKRK